MPRITSLPGGESTSLSSTDNLIVEPSGGQTKYAALTAVAQSMPSFGCRLSESAVQAIDASTITAIEFTTEQLDTSGFHESVTNPSRITIPTGMGGRYAVGGSLAWTGDSVGNRALHLRKNGTVFREYDVRGNLGSHRVVNHVTSFLSLAADDYLELCGFHDSTTDPLNTWWGAAPGAEVETFFWIFKVGIAV